MIRSLKSSCQKTLEKFTSNCVAVIGFQDQHKLFIFDKQSYVFKECMQSQRSRIDFSCTICSQRIKVVVPLQAYQESTIICKCDKCLNNYIVRDQLELTSFKQSQKQKIIHDSQRLFKSNNPNASKLYVDFQKLYKQPQL